MKQEYILEGKRKRKAKNIKCDNCGIEFLKQERFLKKDTKHYCSRKCVGEAQRIRVDVSCSYCGKIISRTKSDLNKSKSGLYFCDRICKTKAQMFDSDNPIREIMPTHYHTGAGSYRKRALRYYDNKCEICGFDNVLALEVHHRDKNRQNNKIKNLQVLCANCHRITHLKK